MRFVYVLLFFVLGSPAFAWTHGAPIASIGCNIVTGVAVGASGPCASPLAVCNGSGDDAPAFASFNTWAVANQGLSLQVQLTIPPGSTCSFTTNNGSNFSNGIHNLLVLGTGATITNNGSGSVVLDFGAGGICEKGLTRSDGCSARINSVSSGGSTITLTSASLGAGYISRFTVGRYVMVSGFDLQGLWNAPFGAPPNLHYFEFHKVININAGTGVITLDAALRNSYLSTWPNYNTGDGDHPDQGGPATVYALNASWDATVEVRGLTIDSTANITRSSVRKITYRNAIFTGALCAVPSVNILWSAVSGTWTNCIVEVDKLIETASFSGLTLNSLVFQSSSTDLVTIDNVTITAALQGTPKKATISNSTIANFQPGAQNYGRTDEVTCTNCVLPAISVRGVVGQQYSMSAGLMTVPNTANAIPWAVPGTNVFWRGEQNTETIFQVVSVTQDATNTYVQTTLAGGTPPVAVGAGLTVYVHPAPKFTCTNCTGSVDAVDLSQAPAGAPIYSYSKRSYTGDTMNSAPVVIVWGVPVSFNANVTQAYTGVQSSLSLNLFGQFKAGALDPPNYSAGTNWNSSINLKGAGSIGSRTYSAMTGLWSNTKSGDSLTNPGAIWFGATQQVFPSANVSGEASALWPVVSLEIITNQGVVNPFALQDSDWSWLIGDNDNTNWRQAM